MAAISLGWATMRQTPTALKPLRTPSFQATTHRAKYQAICQSLNNMRPIAPFALVCLLLAAPLAAAHAAPAPRDFETRLLHDFNDDSGVVLAGKHGFDTIALDVREGRSPVGQPVLILRLLLNGGCDANLPSECPTLSEVVQFTTNGSQHELTFETADGGATWTGDALHYVGPMGINDGDRFAIEGWFSMSSIGLTTGSVLTDWFVAGFSGDASADNMPEGIAPGIPDVAGGSSQLESYTVGSPDIYADLTSTNETVVAMAGESVRIPVEARNLLGIEQELSFQVLGSIPGRVEIDGAEAQNVSLGAMFSKSVELVVDAPSVDTPILLVATSPLGGWAFLPLNIVIESATMMPPEQNETMHPPSDDGPDEDTKDSPGIGLVAFLVTVAIVGALRRRIRQ